MPAVPSGVPSQVLERRPDILQAEQQLVGGKRPDRRGQGAVFPRRSRSPAATAQASSDLSDLFKGPARVWSYGGSITGPIFAGGAIYGQVMPGRGGSERSPAEFPGGRPERLRR